MLGAGHLGFTGQSQVIVRNIFQNIKDSFTYEFWAKPLSDHKIDPQRSTGSYGNYGQRYAFGAGHGSDTTCAGVGVSVGRNGISVYEHTDSHLPATLVYEAAIDDWTHIAVVFDKKTPLLYVNGEFRTGGLTSSKDHIFASGNIGCLAPYGAFVGLLDEVRIWDHARTELEIQGLMFSELNGTEPGLFAYWPFNEGVGPTAHDLTINQNHGHVDGAFWHVNSFNIDNRNKQELALSISKEVRPFIVVVSHTDFMSSMGGTEKYISEQLRHLLDNGFSVLQIYPADRYTFGGADKARYGIRVDFDSKFKGYYFIHEIIELLGGIGRLDKFLVHHLQNWQHSDFNLLLNYISNHVRAGMSLFLHDYMTCCPSIQLCYAEGKERVSCVPELLANPELSHCAKCPFSDIAAQWRTVFYSVFQHMNRIIAPSAIARTIFTRFYPEFAGRTMVWEHQRLVPLTSENSPIQTWLHTESPGMKERNPRRFRLAYLGYESPMKGWAVFERLSSDDGLKELYDFYLIGSGKHIDNVIRHSFSFLRGGAMAAVDVLKEHDIDLVLLWSICSETYSYTLHEAIAAGVPILTCRQSGNIADKVKRSVSLGRVFQSELELHSFLLDQDRVQALVDHPRTQYLLQYSPPPI